ncbi:MAG: glutaminyl-peptide cyclotransferase [Acidobacteria bacterium]|nr:glutaminyl-peptide cyclotransferase [Acidobacteriota bacterium]
MRLIAIVLTAVFACSCSGGANNAKPNVNSSPAKQGALPVYGYEVVKAYPHDEKCFTEGLFFAEGFLYESCGEEKQSSLRKVDLESGKVVQKWDNPPEDFGEGIVLFNGQIYQLTWEQELGRIFDAKSFKLLKEFHYQGQGWGMTTDGTNLIFDQGTHVLKVAEPDTFKTLKTIPIMRDDGKPLMQMNELEWVKGELWANIWHSEDPAILGKRNYIARIDLNSAKLLGWIDLEGISPDDVPAPAHANDPYDPKKENTLNGIAYDAANDRIFVTGKNWKKLYEIKVTPPKNQ